MIAAKWGHGVLQAVVSLGCLRDGRCGAAVGVAQGRSGMFVLSCHCANQGHLRLAGCGRPASAA
jgi:hypothetical protein